MYRYLAEQDKKFIPVAEEAYKKTGNTLNHAVFVADMFKNPQKAV